MENNLVFCHFKTGLAGMPQSLEKELYHDLPTPIITIDFFPKPSIVFTHSIEDPNKKVYTGNRLTDYQKNILMQWITNNSNHPYPNNSQKLELMKLTGLDRHRLNVWFTNHRIRGNYAFRQRRVDPTYIPKEFIPLQLQSNSTNQKQKSAKSKTFNINQNQIQAPNPSTIAISPPIPNQSILQNPSNQKVQFTMPIISIISSNPMPNLLE